MPCIMTSFNGIKQYCDCRDVYNDGECITSGWKKVANNRTIKCMFYEPNEDES